MDSEMDELMSISDSEEFKEFLQKDELMSISSDSEEYKDITNVLGEFLNQELNLDTGLTGCDGKVQRGGGAENDDNQPGTSGQGQGQEKQVDNAENELSLDDDDDTEDSIDPDYVSGPLDVPNFPNHFFHLELKRTRSFKHKQTDIVNEHSYVARLRQNVLTAPHATLGDIHNQLYLLFDSLLNELNNTYSPSDLVRVFITHEEMVNTNIIVGPDYLGNISPQVIMDQIADVIRSNNFIPADEKLSINVAAIRNIKGLRSAYVTDLARDLSRKGCIIQVNNEDTLCLPRAIAVAAAKLEMESDKSNPMWKKNYETMRKSRNNNSLRNCMSLQKKTALKYQRMAGIEANSIGLLTDVVKYEDALKIGINVISARGGNKKVRQGNKAYSKQIYLYHVQCDGDVGHFSVLTRVNALLARSYYCDDCDVGFNNNDRHRCKNWCDICGAKGCNQSNEETSCPTCNAPCRSPACLERHVTPNKRTRKSKCDMMLFCPDCKAALRTKNRVRTLQNHTCGESYCQNCEVFYCPPHVCYMRSTPAAQSLIDEKRFIFFDFESMQTQNGDHVPNLVVARSICEACKDVTSLTEKSKCSRCGHRCEICSQTSPNGSSYKFDNPCMTCGQREKVFSGPTTVDDFCAWLISRQHRNFTVMAHNARAYDAYFIYSYLIRNSIIPEIIFRGSKIIYCHIGRGLNIRILDSLNFLIMPLSQLPKSFGLVELKKGFFPYLYNHEDIVNDPHQTHLSHLPDKYYYDPDNMKSSRRKEFEKWYELNQTNEFDLFKELIDYCRSDVDILLQSCWKFRTLFMQITGPDNPIDPFDYTTIASVCMGVFRTKFLPEEWSLLRRKDAKLGCSHEASCQCTWTQARRVNGDSPLEVLEPDGSWKALTEEEQRFLVRKRFQKSPIALPPPHGYSRKDNFSKQSMEWIKWYEKDNGVTLQHALSTNGEKRIHHETNASVIYILDGFYVDDHGQKHALEFNGCWYHGCPACYPRDRSTTRIGGKNLNVRYIETMNKRSYLQERGFVVHTMWSCEWERVKKVNSAVRQAVDELEIEQPIDLREAYFGGRTNGIVLSMDISLPMKSFYYDFCSLYPDVLKYQRYPVGHPSRIVSNFVVPQLQGDQLDFPYFGLMKVAILPPRKLLFPVLPMKINDKLMFTLCRTCAVKENAEGCSCSDRDRTLIHTWTTVELEVALLVGYKILKIYEILHWEHTEKFDPLTGQGGLFTQYINTFLRIKAEASGYPADADTPEKKAKYIEEFRQNEGVTLTPDSIQKNPGLRSIAKLALNSFYGKFGQRTNMRKSTYVTTANDIYRLMTDYTKTIKDFHVLNEDLVIMEHVNTAEFQETDRKTNVIIAAFCTSYARIKLWKVLHTLGERVLYHDTDSIIFTGLPPQPNPPIGKFLGELTDELACKELGCPGCDEGHWIVEFVSCGAKNYAYRLNSGQVVCKVRGFSLNFSASQVINLESMKSALLAWKNGEDQGPMTTVKALIQRNKYTAVVYSKQMPKNYAVVYNKRCVQSDWSTLPYGF